MAVRRGSTRSRPESSCSRWQRWFSGVSKRRIAGTVGFALMSILSVTRMVKYGARRPKDVRNYATRSRFKQLSPWTPGILDIHHLQVGSSVSTFVIMPDGTTMLIDAGDVNVPYTLSEWSKQGPPFDTLNVKSPYPNDSKTPVGWIIDYMKDFWPSTKRGKKLVLDYLLLTHFHSDHFGDGNAELTIRSNSKSGKYVLSGIPELASKVGVKKIIDRGFPDYNVPQDLRSLHDKSIDNYLQFVQENKKSIQFEQFKVGNSQQIRMRQRKKKTDFRIRVLKSGMQVAAPHDKQRPKDDPVPVQQIPNGEALKDNLHGSENTMSAAIVVEYGSFRYYEGADQEVIRNSNGDIVFDTIRPTAKSAGKVDVATLNHHGHGVSQEYLNYIDPHIMILQGWSSDQPPKRSMEMLAAPAPEGGGVPRKIFATDVFQERLDDLGPSLSKLFQSKSGHVVVRVQPPGKAANLRGSGTNAMQQTFEIVVLDGNRHVKAHYGHFPVRRTQ